nr:alpha/beta hydrolase [Cryobacterium lactosi]
MKARLARSAILFLHGLTSSGNTWAPLARMASEHGAIVTAPDLRGHGEDPSSSGFRIDDYATDVLAIAAPAGGWDLVVAHSLGGTIAVRIASSNPHWAKRMLLLDPVIELAQAAAEDALADNLGALSNVVVDDVMRHNPLWSRETAELKVRDVQQVTADVVRQSIEANLPWSLSPELALVSATTLIIGADPAMGAPSVGPDDGPILAGSMPHGRYEMAQGTSHSVHRDRPDIVFTAITELLHR